MTDSTTKAVVLEVVASLPESGSEELEWYTPKETCDACGSQSYYMVVFDAGNLFFCSHHFKKNEAVIFEKAFDIVDESELLKP